MRFVIRFDSWHGKHVRFTIFGNGGNCGSLCMTVQEYQAFVATLLLGQGVTGGVIKVMSDDGGFREVALEQASTQDGEPTVEASPNVYANMLLDRRGR
jgi:hypothetical protein